MPVLTYELPQSLRYVRPTKDMSPALLESDVSRLVCDSRRRGRVMSVWHGLTEEELGARRGPFNVLILQEVTD
jgi:hypothetical protein